MSTSQNTEYFLNSLTKIINYFANTYDNHLILGDFNLEQTDSTLMGFLDSTSLTSLIETNTCFKGKGSCIDLILTNRKFSFKFTSTYETGISDHHYMIYTILKSCFQNTESKRLKYRDLKSFLPEEFKEDLGEMDLSDLIMKRSRLGNKTNKTKKPIHISNFRKQCNDVFNLNKQAKFEYFSPYNSADRKPF